MTHTQGFPETPGKYGPRTIADYQRIAGIITNRLLAKILVLNEINGKWPALGGVGSAC